MVLPSGRPCIRLSAVDSTNAEARRQLASGASSSLWVVADEQSEGRGRYGRRWESPAGNLYATLLLIDALDIKSAGQLSFVAALAVSDVLKAHAPSALVEVKWPNDILIDGRKASGILLETCRSRGTEVEALAVGIGVNIASHPDDTAFPATCLAAHVRPAPSCDTVLGALDASFLRRYEEWRDKGFAPLREAWLERAAGLGGPLLAALPNERVSGIFETLAPTGELVLSLPGGATRLLSAADIFFGDPPMTERAHAADD